LAIAAVNEHQVDIGAVIELLPAQLAERNYRESTGAAIGQARLAVARDEVVAEVPVRHAQNRVGHARELLGNLRQAGHSSTSRSAIRSNWRRRNPRQFDSGRHAAVARAEKIVQPLLVLFHRQHPVKITGAGNLQDLLRVLEDGIGKKRAVREYIGRRLQGRRRAGDAVEGGRGSLPQPLQVARRRLRVRHRSQQQPDTRRHALGNAIEQVSIG